MSKVRPFPLIENLPYYMSAIGMQGARFLEGNDGSGSGSDGDGGGAGSGSSSSTGDDDADLDGLTGPDGKPLGEAGKNAIKAEREQAREAKRKLAEAETERARLQKLVDDAEAAKLSDIEKAQKEAKDKSDRVTALERENWRLAALAEHPVSKESRDLVVGTDAESFLASAKRIHELEAKASGKPGVVPGSGTGGGDSSPSGGSLAGGRDLYNSKHKKTK